MNDSLDSRRTSQKSGLLGAMAARVRRLQDWKHLRNLRAILAGAAMLLALRYFSSVLDGHYAIKDWLFWKYAKVWLWLFLWLAGCFSGGLAIVERLTPRLPLRERIVQSFAVGVYAYYLLQFTGGILHLFGSRWAILVPVGMLLGGAYDRRRSWERFWRERRRLRRLVRFRIELWQVPIVIFGISAVALLYYATLTPRNIAFDAQWYHLGLPQGWAAEGAITRSDEGWFYEAIPNLAAVLYSYAFTLPRLDLFEIVTLCAHMEFALFIATLVAIPVLVRWLVPRAHAGVAWVAVFLFPSVYIYDASFHSGNDHVAAFFAVPIYLALRRAYKRLEWRHSALLAICASGAIMTKYQAVNTVVGPALFIVIRAIYLGVTRREGRAAWLGPLCALGVGLALTAPLWAKNLVWYGDPLYPAFYKYLPDRPRGPDFTQTVEWSWKRTVARADGTRYEILRETFLAGFDHSFRSFSSATRFHGKWPYFGSLFVLSMLWLPFLSGTKRVWGLVISAQLGVFLWYYLSFVERYLQALVPVMAAAVAASIALAWRHGWFARVPLIALTALQLIWGGDAFFFPSHAMSRHALTHTMNLLASGFEHKLELHENVNPPFDGIGAALPKGSTVLLHDFNPRLGLRAKVVTDMAGLQGLIRYGAYDSLQTVHDLYRSLGVTHVLWQRKKSDGWDTIAGDLRFFEYVTNAVEDRRAGGSWDYAHISENVPATIGDNIVVYASCNQDFMPGLYHLVDMNLAARKVRADTGKVFGYAYLPRDAEAAREALASAEFVVYGSKGCRGEVPYNPDGFVHAATRKGEELWVRQY